MGYVLTCQDNLSKYLIGTVYRFQSDSRSSSRTICRKYYSYMYSRIPNAMLTDQGTQFMSDVFKRALQNVEDRRVSHNRL